MRMTFDKTFSSVRGLAVSLQECSSDIGIGNCPSIFFRPPEIITTQATFFAATGLFLELTLLFLCGLQASKFKVHPLTLHCLFIIICSLDYFIIALPFQMYHFYIQHGILPLPSPLWFPALSVAQICQTLKVKTIDQNA